MAKKKWLVLPGGHIKRWKRSENERGCDWVRQVPPHWYRNYLNRRERRKSEIALRPALIRKTCRSSRAGAVSDAGRSRSKT